VNLFVAGSEKDTDKRTDGIGLIIFNWDDEWAIPRAIRAGLRAVELLREKGLSGEVEVVDDASRDGSIVPMRQLEALYDGRVMRVLALGRNAGASFTRIPRPGERPR
jgi:hypothetical protein